jgi:uncharacterized protein YuzE
MKLIISKEDDALYLRLNDDPIIESEEVENGIILDYNTAGKVVGIEMLYISERSPDSLNKILLETA